MRSNGTQPIGPGIEGGETYIVALLELHDELFETLVGVQQLFLACIEQDLNKINISWSANFAEKMGCWDSPCTRDLRPRLEL